MTEKLSAFTMYVDKYEKPVGMFFSCRGGGQAARLFGPPAAFYCKFAPAHPPAADAAAVRRGYEKIWRCNKTQWIQF